MTRPRRVALVLLAGVFPWVFVTWPEGWYPLFSFGFVHFDPFAFTSLPAYVGMVGSVPSDFSAWPIASFLWVCAVLSAAIDRVDPAVTVGLLALAGASVLSLSVSLSGQRGITAIPVGTLWLWAVAGLRYVQLFREE